MHIKFQRGHSKTRIRSHNEIATWVFALPRNRQTPQIPTLYLFSTFYPSANTSTHPPEVIKTLQELKFAGQASAV